ncbi:MAG: DUF748 domain-containing protein [Candidatus Omnitrophica bacterium]|nr:DUF748 domain-containing protein [Candidatus Omnitrophota bacterium]MCF7877738.1 DUF748 domain-containing protein [Candidatus Omnitrophota bacterium]MCF7891500.1 DUF748 domain-containing protein [Candidatus Omnitrophota bacterium]MCF7896077.1 DUF748 domain-containing protein [Candidatus Omnitrophota bacterium]MCF7897388.1 DUF748 domain-containing protein [Candidatus Omnitrophota bacterium]
MKNFFIAILVVLFIVAVLYIGLFALINTKGKDIAINRIEDSLGVRPKIGSVSLRFPFILEIVDFRLENLSFSDAEIYFGGFNLFKPSLKLERVYLERLNVEVTKKDGKIRAGGIPLKEATGKGQSEENQESKNGSDEKTREGVNKKENKNISIEVKNFYLNDSTIKYSDQSRPEPVDLALLDVNLTAKNISYPKLSKLSFYFSSSLKTDIVLKDLIAAKGWINYLDKSMDVDLTVDSFKYSAVSDFCPSPWRAENLGIEEAFLSLESKLKAEENNLIVDSTLILDEIEFMEIKEENKKVLSRQRFAKTVVALLKDEQDVAKIRIKLTTKMDKPELKISSIQKSLRKSLPIGAGVITGQLMHKTGDAVKGGFGKAKDIPKNTLEATVDTIKDTLGRIKDIIVGPKPDDKQSE